MSIKNVEMLDCLSELIRTDYEPVRPKRNLIATSYHLPLIGLEYIVEFRDSSNEKHEGYYCVLCEFDVDSLYLLGHVTSLYHQTKYMFKFFPSVNKMFAENTKFSTWSKDLIRVFDKVLDIIALKFGRMDRMIKQKDEFYSGKAQVRRILELGPHLCESRSFNFESVPSPITGSADDCLKCLKEIEASISKSKTNSTSIPDTKINKNDGKESLTVGAAESDDALKKRRRIRNRNYRTNDSASFFEDLVVTDEVSGDEDGKDDTNEIQIVSEKIRSKTEYKTPPDKHEPFKKGRSSERRSQKDFNNSRSLSSRDFRSNQRFNRHPDNWPHKFGQRNSNSFRRKSLDDASSSPSKRQRLEETLSDRGPEGKDKDTCLEALPTGSPETNMDKYEKLLGELRRLGSSRLQTWLSYINKPETHPEYPEEWKKYWKTKYKSLCEEGEDPKTYDFKADWVVHWDEFIMAEMSKELATMKTARSSKEHVEKIVEDKISFNLVNAEGKKVVLDQSTSFKGSSERLKASEGNAFVTMRHHGPSQPDKATLPKNGSNSYGYSKNQYTWQRNKPEGAPRPASEAQARKPEEARGRYEGSQNKNVRQGPPQLGRGMRRGGHESSNLHQSSRPPFSKDTDQEWRHRNQENPVGRRGVSPDLFRDRSGFTHDIASIRQKFSPARGGTSPSDWPEKRGHSRGHSREIYRGSREDSRGRRVISRRGSSDRRHLSREGSRSTMGVSRGGSTDRRSFSRERHRPGRSRGDSMGRPSPSRDDYRDRREDARDRPEFTRRHSVERRDLDPGRRGGDLDSAKTEREYSRRNITERRLLSRDDIAQRLEVSLENSRRELEGELEPCRPKQLAGDFSLDTSRERFVGQRPMAPAGRSPMDFSGFHHTNSGGPAMSQRMPSGNSWERLGSPDGKEMEAASRGERDVMGYKDSWEHQRTISASSKPGLTITIENFRNPTPPKDSEQDLPLDKPVSFCFFLKYLHDNFESSLKFLSDRIRVIYIRASNLEQESASSSVALLKESSCRDVVIDIGYKLTEMAQDCSSRGTVPYKIKWALAQISAFLAKTSEQGGQPAARLPGQVGVPAARPDEGGYEGRSDNTYAWRDNRNTVDTKSSLGVRTMDQHEGPGGGQYDQSTEADGRYRTISLENVRRDAPRDRGHLNNSVMYQWKGESPNSRIYSDIPAMEPSRDLPGQPGPGEPRPHNPDRNISDGRYFPDNPERDFMSNPPSMPSGRRILRLEDIDFSFLDSREPQVTQNLNSLTIMLQNFSSLAFAIQQKLLEYLKKAEVTKVDELRQLRAAIHGQKLPQHPPPQDFSQSEGIRRAMISPGFMAFAPKEIPDRNPPPMGYPIQLMGNTRNFMGNMRPY